MSKQILFRAQARKKEGRLELNKKHVPIDWVYGSVVHQNSNKKFADIYPQTSENEKISVYADTICQYTGKNDRYGDKIFENDILTFLAHIGGYPYFGKYHESAEHFQTAEKAEEFLLHSNYTTNQFHDTFAKCSVKKVTITETVSVT